MESMAWTTYKSHRRCGIAHRFGAPAVQTDSSARQGAPCHHHHHAPHLQHGASAVAPSLSECTACRSVRGFTMSPTL
jgi:hypothetical protein